jgi:hypothetical protein
VGEGAGKGVLITKQGAAEPADFTATCLLGDIEIVAEESIRSVVRVWRFSHRAHVVLPACLRKQTLWRESF